MPTTVQTAVAGTAERAAARGMLRAINATLVRFRQSVTAERIGFGVGLTAIVIGLSVRARRQKLQRIEQKVDYLADELKGELDVVAATGDLRASAD